MRRATLVLCALILAGCGDDTGGTQTLEGWWQSEGYLHGVRTLHITSETPLSGVTWRRLAATSTRFPEQLTAPR